VSAVSPRIGLDLTALVRAAAEIADRDGLEAVTLASVAHKLNVRPPSLYNHVDGLAGLRRKLAVTGLERLADRLESAGANLAGDAAIYAFAEAYIGFAREHPGLYEATLAAPNPGDEELNRAADRLLGQLVRALSFYGLRGDASLHAVRGLRSLLHGFAELERKGAFGLPLDLDETLRLLIGAYLAGLPVIRSGNGQGTPDRSS
jgi:AcrR family transcriptional regulator